MTMPDSWQQKPIPLSNPAFDRASHRRFEPAFLEAARQSADALVIPVWRSRSLVAGEGEARRAVLIPAASFDWEIAGELAFLGFGAGRPHFGADMSALEPEDVQRRFESHGAFEDLRFTGQWLETEEAALLAYTKGILWWHERHRFCGVCGHPTQSVDGGHRRLCVNESCKAEHFPRSDPAVIMLIEYEDRCLLARGANFPAGFISVLAGFVEPGESLEDTVAREVFEECGVRITDIAYSASQPWPFPSSLMVGFRARAIDPTLTLDPREIVEAGWYSRDWVHSLDPNGPLKIPPRFSISRRLIDDWVNEQ